jgi:hypothetical protein
MPNGVRVLAEFDILDGGQYWRWNLLVLIIIDRSIY